MRKRKLVGEERLRRRRWGCLLMAGLLLVCSVWAVADSLFGFCDPRARIVDVPDFLGMHTDALPSEEWMQIELEFRYDEDTAEGTVMAQSPPPGARRLTAKQGQISVLLTVSLGKESANVPDVVGLDARHAELILRQLGFSVERINVPASGANGTVLTTEPPAGERLPLGTRIILQVSETASVREVKVPDLIGLSRSEALMALWRTGLGVGEVWETDTCDADRLGTVVRQSRVAGTLVPEGTRIDFSVCSCYEE